VSPGILIEIHEGVVKGSFETLSASLGLFYFVIGESVCLGL